MRDTQEEGAVIIGASNFLKDMQGPFYQLLSQEGPRHDDFYTMGT